jgi:hypothetical protein
MAKSYLSIPSQQRIKRTRRNGGNTRAATLNLPETSLIKYSDRALSLAGNRKRLSCLRYMESRPLKIHSKHLELLNVRIRRKSSKKSAKSPPITMKS